MGPHCKIPESLRTHVRSEINRKQISPPSPPQTLNPEKTDQTPHLPTNSSRDPTASEKTNQTQHSPTSETLKPRRCILDFIIIADAEKPNPRARITAKWHHRQHISPPDLLWTLYEEIEGELAAAHNTQTEIRKYIRDLQSHYKPRPAESSTKGPPIPEASYLAPSPDLASDNITPRRKSSQQARHRVPHV
jgi:hypothetical protein